VEVLDCRVIGIKIREKKSVSQNNKRSSSLGEGKSLQRGLGKRGEERWGNRAGRRRELK